MEWRNLKNNFPITGDTVVILVSDGKNVYTAYEDKEQIWFHCDPRENYDAILDRLTHWAYLTDIPLPENHNKDNINDWIKVNSINELPQDEVFISLYRGQMCLTQYDDEEGLFYVSRQPAYYLESFSVPKDLNHKFEYYCLLSYPYEL